VRTQTAVTYVCELPSRVLHASFGALIVVLMIGAKAVLETVGFALVVTHMVMHPEKPLQFPD